MESCKTCRFFIKGELKATSGLSVIVDECRAHPPSSQSNRFPNVHEYDWCGEWQEIPVDFPNPIKAAEQNDAATSLLAAMKRYKSELERMK